MFEHAYTYVHMCTYVHLCAHGGQRTTLGVRIELIEGVHTHRGRGDLLECLIGSGMAVFQRKAKNLVVVHSARLNI